MSNYAALTAQPGRARHTRYRKPAKGRSSMPREKPQSERQFHNERFSQTTDPRAPLDKWYASIRHGVERQNNLVVQYARNPRRARIWMCGRRAFPARPKPSAALLHASQALRMALSNRLPQVDARRAALLICSPRGFVLASVRFFVLKHAIVALPIETKICVMVLVKNVFITKATREENIGGALIYRRNVSRAIGRISPRIKEQLLPKIPMFGLRAAHDFHAISCLCYASRQSRNYIEPGSPRGVIAGRLSNIVKRYLS